MKILKRSFGTTKDGEAASIYTLSNKNGMAVSFTDYGANIVEIILPDKDGVKKDVSLGYADLSGFEGNAPGFGSFIGRHANRIGGASFEINGKVYEIEKNDGTNNLHSGSKSYNKYMYEAETFEEEGMVSIEFSRLSPHMEQGFPGNLDITVTYSVTDEDELVIEYFAVCDQDTIINFTNHTYFNLAGHNSGSVLNHKVLIDSDAYTKTDEALIPTGALTDVTGTPFDFRVMKTIGEDINASDEAIKIGGGYDHNFVLKTVRDEVSKVAELWDEESGRRMEIFTDLPGMQLYTANFLNGEKGKDGCTYNARDGVCFETQFYPNACNMKDVPNGRVKAGEEFESTTIYKFSIK